MRIEDYAIVGDTQTIALVGRNGSVDWHFPQAFSHVALINSARNLSGEGGPAQQRAARSE